MKILRRHSQNYPGTGPDSQKLGVFIKTDIVTGLGKVSPNITLNMPTYCHVRPEPA
jgi:hypothetical protein